MTTPSGLESVARVGRPRDEDVTARVLAATVGLVRERGYAGTTLDDVAAAAGVAKTTVYRRWTSKRSLVVSALVDALGEPPAPQGGRRDGLRLAIDWLATVTRDPGVHQLIIGLLGEASRDRELRAELRARIREPFQERVVSQWEIDPSRVELAFDVVVGTVVHRLAMTGAIKPADLARIAELADSLLAPQPRAAAPKRPGDQPNPSALRPSTNAPEPKNPSKAKPSD